MNILLGKIELTAPPAQYTYIYIWLEIVLSAVRKVTSRYSSTRYSFKSEVTRTQWNY